jgi:hypothetical protein
MSYYEKYIKYKNKYIQYKKSLEINMQKGGKSYNNGSNSLLHIDNLTATPTINNTKHTHVNNLVGGNNINMLTATPHLSEIAGGAYNSKKQQRLLKLLESSETHSEINTTTNNSDDDEKRNAYGNIKNMDDLKGKSYIKDRDHFPYFAKDRTVSSSSSATSSSDF